MSLDSLDIGDVKEAQQGQDDDGMFDGTENEIMEMI